MMATSKQIKDSFNFLRAKAESGETFTLDELVAASGWTVLNTTTNISKRIGEFVVPVGAECYRAKAVILRVRPHEYESLFTQKNLLFGNYRRLLFPHVITYDFFLPLSREARLREGLDNLFYVEAIEQRLREIPVSSIEMGFPRLPDESDEKLRDRVRAQVGVVFVGYSISHVNGRFRDGKLLSRTEAAKRVRDKGPYLVDETTAVVRFIMRCGSSQCEWSVDDAPLTPNEANLEQEAAQIEWIFFNIFAEAVVKQVNYEDEIWLLEGGLRNRLIVWERVGS